MSEYIPLEIQVEVIKRLPVKSVLQFRSVSKQLKCLIDSSEFISGYRAGQTDPQRLLVWYRDPADNKEKYVRFVDDDDVEAFSQQDLAPTAHLLSKFLGDLKMVGSSQGLLCFYGYYQDPGNPLFNNATKMAVVWNPSIRKSVCIPVPGMFCRGTVVGFGVCPITGGPTIVKITNVSMYFGTVDSSPRVEVFTLSGGSWKVPLSNLPKKSIQVTWSQVVIDSYIYWVAFDTDAAMDDEFPLRKNMIVSFDMTTEEFRVIDLPKSLADHGFMRATLSVSKLGCSLAVIECVTYTEVETDLELQVCTVWIMEHTVSNSFTKLFTIEKECDSLKILGFTKRGEAIMETQDDYDEPAALVVYEPTSKHINETGIYGENGSLFVSSYMETLILLDHPDCSILF